MRPTTTAWVYRRDEVGTGAVGQGRYKEAKPDAHLADWILAKVQRSLGQKRTSATAYRLLMARANYLKVQSEDTMNTGLFAKKRPACIQPETP